MPARSAPAFRRPSLRLEEFFDGSAKGWGFTHSRFGTLSQHFDIKAQGKWNEATRTLLLNEVYLFDDGHRDVLEWRITRHSENRYSGTETNLKGEAQGEQSDNHFRWKYVRDVPQAGGGPTRMAFDDCFYLQEPKVLMARATVSRFGFEIGVITVTYLKS